MSVWTICGSISCFDGVKTTFTDPNLPAPRKLLAFYGYHTFELPEFRKPVSAYCKQAAVTEEDVRRILANEALTEESMDRYLLYLYGRQTGCWPQFLTHDLKSPRFALQEGDYSKLPPTFFTAGSSDYDVPFRESKQMSKKIPGSRFVPVYYGEHDFDRDPNNKEAMNVYLAALEFLEN